MLSSKEIAKIDFTKPEPPPATHSSKHALKRARRQARKALQPKPHNKREPDALSSLELNTLDELALSTSEALRSILDNSLDLPESTLLCMAESREFDDLVDLGKSHFNYAILSILRRRLPSKALSRGSLTVGNPTANHELRWDTCPRPKIFDSVCDRANEWVVCLHIGGVLTIRRLRPLHETEESTDDDDTKKVLIAIRTDTPVENNSEQPSMRGPLKRRYSPPTGKENLALLPQSPKREIKRRKSVNGPPSGVESDLGNISYLSPYFIQLTYTMQELGPADALPILPSSDTQGSEGKSASAVTSLEPCLSVMPTITVSEPDANQPKQAEAKASDPRAESPSPGDFSPPATDHPLPDSRLSEHATSPQAIVVSQSLEADAEVTKGVEAEGSVPRDESSSGNNFSLGDEGALKKLKGLKRVQAIQNAIIAALLDPKFKLVFQNLANEVWKILLSNSWIRDPFETCGDAAMHVVLTELLIERPRKDVKGPSIRKGIIAPVLSNATFLNLLLSRRFVTYDAARLVKKYPGNAFEVFAGALAAFYSLGDLKSWSGVALEPAIAAAIETLLEFDAAMPSKADEDGPSLPEDQQKQKAFPAKKQRSKKNIRVDLAPLPDKSQRRRKAKKIINGTLHAPSPQEAQAELAPVLSSDLSTTLGAPQPSFAAGFQEFSFAHPVPEASSSAHFSEPSPLQINGRPPFVFDPLEWLEQEYCQQHICIETVGRAYIVLQNKHEPLTGSYISSYPNSGLGLLEQSEAEQMTRGK
ncbi:hypothetical protein FB451DRAFT_1176106 [Mycena latifolia]|nr:hypothetical protein FB451DRAFT_1176106 [Mycena latifolia]